MSEGIFSKTTKFRENVEDFLHWWLSELYACVPLNLRTKFAQKKPRAWVNILRNSVVIELLDNGMVHDTINLPNLEDLQDDEWCIIASILHLRQSIIILDHPFCYISNIKLPKSGYHYDRKIINFHIERISPIDIDKITWNWGVMVNNGEIFAQIAITKIEYFDKIDDIFDAHHIATPSIAARSGISYIPIRNGEDASVSPQQRRDRNIYIVAATIIFSIPVLMIGTLSILNASIRSENSVLESQVADQLDLDLMRRQIIHDQMVARPIASVPLVSSLFEQFARRLPPEAHLKSLREQADGIVIVEVVGGDADQLVANLVTEFAAVTRLTDAEPATNPAGEPAATSFSNAPLLPVRLEIRR